VKNTVAKLWGGEDIDKSLEISMKDVEARLASAAEAEEAAHTEGHRETEDARPLRVPLKPRAEAPLKPQTRSLLQAPKKKDGFEKSDARGMALTSTSYNNLSAVGQLQNKLAGTLARPERPPDAFALLRQARDQGVLFQEDSQRDGHSEDQDDPELADAVEECITLCFGVRGILRIGPGRNEQREPIIVVVAMAGFSEASLARVPLKVHRFETLVALPFDLLPLKRER
jgi:hypothetical protein